MTLPLLLALLFVALTIFVWTILRLSSLGYGRNQSGFITRAEEQDLLITATQISRELGGNLSEIFERLAIRLPGPSPTSKTY